MQIVEGLELRQLSDDLYVLEVVPGKGPINFNQIVTFNSTTAYLWKSLTNIDFDEYTLADLLIAKYDVTDEQALTDSIDILRQWESAGLVKHI